MTIYIHVYYMYIIYVYLKIYIYIFYFPEKYDGMFNMSCGYWHAGMLVILSSDNINNVLIYFYISDPKMIWKSTAIILWTCLPSSQYSSGLQCSTWKEDLTAPSLTKMAALVKNCRYMLLAFPLFPLVSPIYMLSKEETLWCTLITWKAVTLA